MASPSRSSSEASLRFLPARLLLSAGLRFLFIRRYLVMRFEVFVYVNTEFFFLQITYMAVAGKDFEIFSKEFTRWFLLSPETRL